MKIRFWWYCTLLSAVIFFSNCHLQSSYSKRIIPMRELSNQNLDLVKQDSLWQVPPPPDSLVN